MPHNRMIESMVLSDANLAPVARRPRRGLEQARPVPAPGAAAPQAAVDVGSLLSFVAGVSAAQKDDVLMSVQLAQRGASGKFDRFKQTESWYQLYADILQNVGWVGEQFAFAKNDQTQGELRMDRAALAIITAIATQNQLAVLQESIQALSALAEDDGTIRLFDFHSSAQGGGNFQIGAVQVGTNGALTMALGAFYFHHTDARKRVLFFSWGAQQVEFFTAASKMTLNEAFYAERREAVQRKLGAGADDFIAGLALG